MENSCRYIAYVDDYVHDEMNPDERRDFESHLGSCRKCTEEIEKLTGIQSLLDRSFSVQPDERFNYSVVAELRKRQKPEPAGEIRIALEDIIISLATLMAIVLIAIQLFSRPKISSVDMVGKLDRIERSSMEQTSLSNDQVLELVLRNK